MQNLHAKQMCVLSSSMKLGPGSTSRQGFWCGCVNVSSITQGTYNYIDFCGRPRFDFCAFTKTIVKRRGKRYSVELTNICWLTQRVLEINGTMLSHTVSCSQVVTEVEFYGKGIDGAKIKKCHPFNWNLLKIIAKLPEKNQVKRFRGLLKILRQCLDTSRMVTFWTIRDKRIWVL